MARFLRGQPVDVTGTPFAQQPNAIADALPQFLTGRQTPAQQRAVDPQTMGHDLPVMNGGGTFQKPSEMMWGEALASPMQRKIGEALGGETGSKAMMLANFLGPAVKLPVPAMAPSGMGGGLLQRAKQMVGLGVKPAPEPTGIRAYHGSPHDFEKFSLDKIGTGEGAQAYGHGLYFAEKEGIAKGYRDKLVDQTNFIRPDGSQWDPSGLQHVNVRATAYKGDLDAAIARASQIASGDSPMAGMAAQDLASLQQLKASGGIAPNPGRMYEVNINADPAHFLDWDAPLSQQSDKARTALMQTETFKEHSDLSRIVAQAESTGRHFDGLADYKQRITDLEPELLAMALQKPETAHALREAGIPGVKYRDAGSRGADGGGGTSNYVVFDDSLISILRKYGLLPLVPGTIAATQGGNGGNGTDY